MSFTAFQQNSGFRRQVEGFSEILRAEMHMLGNNSLDDSEFYTGDRIRGANERLEGHYAESMHVKRWLVPHAFDCYTERVSLTIGRMPVEMTAMTKLSASDPDDYPSSNRMGALTETTPTSSKGRRVQPSL